MHVVFRYVLGLLFLTAAGWLTGQTTAVAQSAGPSLIVDAATGSVLQEDRASQAWHPASTTKMMTAYVALRAVRAGRIGLETAIPASALAARQPRVKVYIKVGQEITLDAALKIMMVKSANDISYVIAEGVGGTAENFVAMMNAEAQRLGMRDTVFRNPNGWHHPEQQTTARDLTVLALAMMREFPEYGDYWGIGAVQIGRTVLNNTNGLIGRYAGANGFKTGFVCASGFNLVATATRGGRTLIAVVLGAYSGAERTVKAAQLLDAGFATWGGGTRHVRDIPASGTTARSICAEVRAAGRGTILADDADSTGPISVAANIVASESGSSNYAVFAAPAAGAAIRSAGGRVSLGARQSFAPIQLAYGRTAGTARAPLAANVSGRRPTAVAQQERPAAPGPADAAGAAAGLAAAGLAATGRPPAGQPAESAAVLRARAANSRAASGAIAPSAATTAFAPATQALAAPAAGSTPIRLHGAIAGAQPAELRPSAAAGIRAAPPRPAPVQSAARGNQPRPLQTPPVPQRATQAVPAKPPAAQTRSASARPAQVGPSAARPGTAPTPPRRPRPPADE